MKEETPMSNHLNEFHTIFSQLTTQNIQFIEVVNAMFLLIAHWDTLRTTLSNIKGSLLTEDFNHKNADKGKSNNALVVRGRIANKEKKGNHNQSLSKSRDSKAKCYLECYYCGKKGIEKKVNLKLENARDARN